MIEVIKAVFTNYIACAVIGGVLEYLTPEKMRKTLRTSVVSLMLLTSLLPIFKIDIDFSELQSSSEKYEEQQYNALYRTASLTERTLYNEMKNILINLNIDEYEIYIETSADKDENTVYLEEIKIEVSEEFEGKTEAVKKAVSTEYKDILKVGVKNE